MGAPSVDIAIVQGKTFEFVYRYADSELVYLPIEAMLTAAPVRLRVTAHGIPDGWPIRIEGVKSPAELNSVSDDCEFHFFASVVDSDTIELNQVNASSWRAYGGGGAVVFHKPYDLSGHSARMQVRDRVGGAILLNIASDPLSSPDGLIDVDIELAALVVKISPATTAAIGWKVGVYDLEVVAPSGDVYPITSVSQVNVTPEVTK